MSDIARESMCKWDGWEELDYSHIFDPMVFETKYPQGPQQTLDTWLENNLGSDIGVGLVKTVVPPGIWKWFCTQHPYFYPLKHGDIPFADPQKDDEVLVFRRNRFYLKKDPGEPIGVKTPAIEWVTWIDTEEGEPNGFFFYKKSDREWWENFWPDDMILFIPLG